LLIKLVLIINLSLCRTVTFCRMLTSSCIFSV